MKNITKIKKLEQRLKINRDISIDAVDITKVRTTQRLNIDYSKSSLMRILDFIISTENPYMIKVNGTIVKMEFSNTNIKAEECINRVFYDLYK